MEAIKNECKQSYLSGLVASVVSIVVKPLVGIFPFTNRALDHDRNFDPINSLTGMDVDLRPFFDELHSRLRIYVNIWTPETCGNDYERSAF